MLYYSCLYFLILSLTVPQANETEEKRKNVEQPKKRRRLDQLQKEQFTRSTKKSPVNSRKLRNGKEGEKV